MGCTLLLFVVCETKTSLYVMKCCKVHGFIPSCTKIQLVFTDGNFVITLIGSNIPFY